MSYCQKAVIWEKGRVMISSKGLVAGAVLAISAAGANAATYHPTAVADVEYGQCSGTKLFCGLNDRQNVNNAIDDDAGTFYSLGFGGSIVLAFTMPMTQVAKTISIFETTFNRLSNHNEAVDVYAVNGSQETLLGRVTNILGESSIATNAAFQFLKLVDVSKAAFPNTTSYDGFDVSKVNVVTPASEAPPMAPIPLPATGLMLVAGIGGLAAMRRRKTAV